MSSVSTGFAKQIIRILRILRYNGSLVTSPVVSLTTVKFKPSIFSTNNPESELLYDWRFTANQFVLATSPSRLTTNTFVFEMNTCKDRRESVFSIIACFKVAWETSTELFPSNGSFTVACLHRYIFIWQWVYESQYFNLGHSKISATLSLEQIRS
jgi:hypothetical protein